MQTHRAAADDVPSDHVTVCGEEEAVGVELAAWVDPQLGGGGVGLQHWLVGGVAADKDVVRGRRNNVVAPVSSLVPVGVYSSSPRVVEGARVVAVGERDQCRCGLPGGVGGDDAQDLGDGWNGDGQAEWPCA